MSDLNRTSLILFDWDGCLADTLSIWLAAYRTTFASFGFSPSDSEITGKVFGDWNGAAIIGVDDVTAFNKELVARVDAGMPHVTANPGAYELVQALSLAGRTVAVLTSSARPTVAPSLERLGFSPYVSLLLCGEDVTRHKPDPEIISKASARTGIPLRHAVIIGDSDKDVLAGKAAGIPTVLYYPPANETYYPREKQDALGASVMTHSFSDLKSLLLG